MGQRGFKGTHFVRGGLPNSSMLVGSMGAGSGGLTSASRDFVRRGRDAAVSSATRNFTGTSCNARQSAQEMVWVTQ